MRAELPDLVTKMLSQMHNLHSLGIMRTTTCIAAAISRLLPPIPLKSIHVGGLLGPSHSLRSFLSNYGHTIEEFAIYSCLLDENCSGTFGFLLHHCPKLHVLRLKAMASVQATGDINYNTKINGIDGCATRGRGEVTKILARLCGICEE